MFPLKMCVRMVDSLSLSCQHVLTFPCLSLSVGMAVVLSSWLSEMGFLNWFYAEANAFELSVAEGGSVLCLVERCRGVRAVFLGKVIVAWLSATMELFVQGKESTEFIKSPRDGNKAFLAQRCFNRSVQYLTVVEYRCGEQRGFIVIPEGREGRD